METPEYPSNRISDPGSPAASRFKDRETPPPVDKNIKRVTSSEPKRQRKSMRKQFKNVFLNGDAKGTAQYVVFGVLVPAAQDMVVDAITGGVERMVKGESRRRRPTPPPSGPSGFVGYNRYYMGGQQQPQQEPPRYMSRRARAQHNFDEIVLTSRAEAEEVIERMFDIVGRYESVTVSDFYELVGLPSTHTDLKWGWTDLRGAGVSRVRNGYLLDLPEPEVLGS